MKNLFALVFLLVITNCIGQTSEPLRIKFTYDDAGNQTIRELCLCAARIATDSIPTPKTMETLTQEDLIQDDVYNQISYYPNPVLEELYIKWVNDEKKYVEKIELYSMSGQILKSFSDLRRTEIASVPFHNYPQGMYNVILIYNNGEKKTLKVIKK